MTLMDTIVYTIHFHVYKYLYMHVRTHTYTHTHTLSKGILLYKREPGDIQNQLDKTDMHCKQHTLKSEKLVLVPAFVLMNCGTWDFPPLLWTNISFFLFKIKGLKK